MFYGPMFTISASRIFYAACFSFYILVLNIINIVRHDADPLSIILQYSLIFFFCFFPIINFFSFQKHVLKITSITIIWITSIIVFYRLNYGSIITGELIGTSLTTDIGLGMELLSSSLFFWLLPTALLPSIFILLLKFKKLNKKNIVYGLISTIVSICLAILLLFVTGTLSEEKGAVRSPKKVYMMYSHSPLDLVAATYTYFSKFRPEAKAPHLKDISQLDTFKLPPKTNNLKIVIVIGESARWDHFSLNGYNKNTNPKLSLRKNLISFQKTMACATFTTSSLSLLFNRRMCKDISQPITETSFVSIFKNLHFKTHIYSLQIINYLYQKYWGYDVLKMKYSILVDSGKPILTDELLIQPLTEALKQDGNQLIILHTVGSHHKYLDRFPDNFRHSFQNMCRKSDIKSCTSEELNNTYDASIAYTDFFLDEVISLLTNKNALLLYTSDHGESLGEKGIFLHGAPLEMAPIEQLQVPFIIWASDAFLKTGANKHKFENLIKAKKIPAPLSHDNFFHTVLGCSGIEGGHKLIDDKLNLCGHHFLP
ncbi:MAG: hypothetical protein A2Z91_04330 [Deltaproteobacteria bacterium GWA2_38_16]|nr:MAG: hypothetical protein A2Z91_04330 [Deltaproteobacteria bacterium GWA2_38_16]OGQ01770.1 MAG: hypothetical protein A3D19_07850 [Deltaproteobacteria bacterium RIFCSPHIGHO2_02_FULL_38_15]OGQ34585.1 MAG: hypothetical protein A3A72_03865 [Deltaproteobacteria bacterium RIFCSPLOWO2_01_FULL_38_9]OGQ59442.1 MAG: hypothetical protein A3G92_01875 [Deltaproteobacteria bacterium RIFCSPLOWO2_12_FULL_38_8]HBQ21425.1 hypothetical protein [Deltaproteobacteria bacterium]